MYGVENKSSHPETKAASRSRFVPWIVAALVFAICMPLYYTTAKKREAIFDTDSEHSSFFDSTDTEKVKVHVIFHHDQHVYMNLGRLLKRSNYEYFVPRQRTPGYPFLLSLLYDESIAYEGEPDDPRRVSDEYFARCREFNIILSMGLLVVLFLFGISMLGIYGSLLFTWIIGWTLYIFKCIYVQPEMLYYSLFLICFVLLWRQIFNPTWKRGVIAGVLVATAYFVKSALTPLLLLFVVCFAIRRFVELKGSKKAPEFSWKNWGLDIGKGVIVPLLWLVILSPYFAQTATIYDSPFWSVHSKHLMWQEDETSKKKWRTLDDPEKGIPDDAPTFQTYWASHKDDLSHFIERPIEGAENTFGRIRKEFEEFHRITKKRTFRVCILIAVLFFVPMVKLARRYWVELLYILGFFIGYGILYGWMEIIRAGPRLMLSMAPALVFVMIAFLNKFAKVFTVPELGWKVPMKPVAFGITGLCLIVAVYNIIGKGTESAAWLVEGGA